MRASKMSPDPLEIVADSVKGRGRGRSIAPSGRRKPAPNFEAIFDVFFGAKFERQLRKRTGNKVSLVVHGERIMEVRQEAVAFAVDCDERPRPVREAGEMKRKKSAQRMPCRRRPQLIVPLRRLAKLSHVSRRENDMVLLRASDSAGEEIFTEPRMHPVGNVEPW